MNLLSGICACLLFFPVTFIDIVIYCVESDSRMAYKMFSER